MIPPHRRRITAVERHSAPEKQIIGGVGNRLTIATGWPRALRATAARRVATRGISSHYCFVLLRFLSSATAAGGGKATPSDGGSAPRRCGDPHDTESPHGTPPPALQRRQSGAGEPEPMACKPRHPQKIYLRTPSKWPCCRRRDYPDQHECEAIRHTDRSTFASRRRRQTPRPREWSPPGFVFCCVVAGDITKSGLD